MPEIPNPKSSSPHVAGPPISEKPLQSWKEIAAYLEREPRTARRWEKIQGLPVRRHGDSSRASVYAYPRISPKGGRVAYMRVQGG